MQHSESPESIEQPVNERKTWRLKGTSQNQKLTSSKCIFSGMSILLPVLNSKRPPKHTHTHSYRLRWLTLSSPASLHPLLKQLWSYFGINTSWKPANDYQDTEGNSELDLRSRLVKRARPTLSESQSYALRQRQKLTQSWNGWDSTAQTQQFYKVAISSDIFNDK